MSREVEVAVRADAVLGEGPVWDPRRDVLVWTDIERHVLHVSDPATGSDETVRVPGPVGACRSMPRTRFSRASAATASGRANSDQPTSTTARATAAAAPRTATGTVAIRT